MALRPSSLITSQLGREGRTRRQPQLQVSIQEAETLMQELITLPSSQSGKQMRVDAAHFLRVRMSSRFSCSSPGTCPQTIYSEEFLFGDPKIYISWQRRLVSTDREN